jgi:hypothetical protein
MILDHVRFSPTFLNTADRHDLYSLAAVTEDDKGYSVHKLTREEFAKVLALPEVAPLAMGPLANRVAELQAIVDKRKDERKDEREWDSIQELFHPDMNIVDIKAAVEALLKVSAAAKDHMRRTGHVSGDDELRHAIGVAYTALWEGRKTQLEKDEAGEDQPEPREPTKLEALADAWWKESTKGSTIITSAGIWQRCALELRGAIAVGHLPKEDPRDAEPRAIRRGATAEALWQLLDDIDTLSDQIKPSELGGYQRFYQRASSIAQHRHLLLKSDGHKLMWPESNDSVERGGHPRAPVVPNDDKYRDLVECIEHAVGGYAWMATYPENAALARPISELFDRAHVATQPPVPMLLHCPMCHMRHIDEGEFATKHHHTHACQNPKCGHVWRPAIVPTVGVWTLPGFLNEPQAADGDALVGKRVQINSSGVQGRIGSFNGGAYRITTLFVTGEFPRSAFTVLDD